MLDRKYIVENIEAVRENCRLRHARVNLDEFLSLDNERREKTQLAEELKRQANALQAQIKGAKSKEEREPLIEQGRTLREQAKQAELDEEVILTKIEEIQRQIPNMTHPAAPVGEDDTANTEVRFGKTPLPKYDFKPKDHVEIGQALDLIDFDGGARVAGAGFYFLKRDAVLLELALQRYAVGLLMAEGFTPVVTPDLAKNEVLQGTGYIPRGPETQIYSIEHTDLSLVATAEITLGGMLADQILEAEELPLKFCGISHCFRTEAGSHGRASRGLYRVHQFTKVEMFGFTKPDQSEVMLEHFCELECRIFDGLEIPYRVVDTATGDLGGPAYRKYDLEAWMPGRGDGGEYGEVTSASNCTDYQARRLGIRFKSKGEKGTQLVHTLNGTAVAISRALIAVIENHQQADGSIRVPEALRAWVGKDYIGR